MLASCSDDQMVKVWNIADGKKITEFRHSAQVLAVALSADGTYVAAGGKNGEIQQWNLVTKQLRADPYAFNKSIWSIYYNENASALIVGLDGGEVKSAPGPYRNSNFANYKQKLIQPSGELINTLGGAFEFSSNTALAVGGSTASVTWQGKLNVTGNLNSGASSGFSFQYTTLYDDIARLAFSPDSRYLTAGGRLESVYSWDINTNQFLGQVAGVLPPGDPYTSDSQYLALVTEGVIKAKKYGEKDRIVDQLRLYYTSDLKTGRTFSEFPANASVHFAVDNNLLIAGTLTKSKFWDVNSGFETHLREGNNLGCQVTKSANDETIFTASSPLGMMTEWDEAARLICSRAAGFGNRIGSISASRDRFVYINENGLLEMFDTAANQILWRSPAEHPVSTVAFSPDDSLLVTGSKDGTLTMWSVSDGKVLRTIAAHYGPIRTVVFSPDGKRIASGSADGTVRIWEVVQK